jgi:hypothetical protein
MDELVTKYLLKLGIAEVIAQVDAMRGGVPHANRHLRVSPLGERDDANRDSVTMQVELARYGKPLVAVYSSHR